MNGNDWADILDTRTTERYWEKPLFQQWAGETPIKMAGLHLGEEQWRTEAYTEWEKRHPEVKDITSLEERLKIYMRGEETRRHEERIAEIRKEQEEYEERGRRREQARAASRTEEERKRRAEEDYAPLTNYNEEIKSFMNSQEWKSMSEIDRAPFRDKWRKEKERITDRIEKKIKERTEEEEEADEDVNFAEIWQVIKDVNAGRTSSAELSLFLKDKKVSEDLFNSIMEEIPAPPTAEQAEKIRTSREASERRRKEDELLATFGDEYKWLRLAEKDSALYQQAIEAKDQLELDRDTKAFEQKMKTLEFNYKQEQATTKQQNWVTEQADKVAAAEVKKEQWTKEFGADEAQRLFDNEMTTLDYLEKVRAAESNEAITKDRDLKNYTIAGIKEEHSWVQAIHTMGIKDIEMAQSAYEFIMTFDFNKVKEETRATEFGQTYRLDVTKEAAIQDRFTKELAVEMGKLNNKIATDWADLELRGDIEQRISTMAMLNYTRLVKELGIREAEVEIKKLKEKREWWLQGEELRLDNEEAQLKFIETMSKIANDATKVGIQQALANASMANMTNTLKFRYVELAQKSINEGTSPIKISPSLSVTLGNMSSEMQDEVTRWMKTVYDEKKGFYHPKPEEWEKINNFLFGKEGDPRPKERFGVNLDVDEFIRGCAGEFDFSDQMRGWCTVTRDKEFMWERVIAAGVERGVYIAPEIEEAIKKPGWFDTGLGKTLGKIGETFKNWFTFTEPAEVGVEVTPRVTKTGDVRADANNMVDGGETSLSKIRQALLEMGYSESEVDTLPELVGK